MARTQAVSTAQVGAAPFFAGKNKVINGDFRINQRGATSVTTYGSYVFDRFFLDFSGGSATYSSQTFTPGTAPVSGYEGTTYARLVTSSQSGVNDYASINQRIEDVRTLAGQTITVSFWAKASSGTPNIGWGCDFNFGTGGSTGVTPTAPAVKSITTSWARYSFTTTLPSISGKTVGPNSFMSNYIFTSVGSGISALGYAAVGLQNTTIDIWGIQVEAGTVATAFQTATGTIQGELAACQRYYFRATGNTTSYYTMTNMGFARNTTIAYIPFQVPVTMRAMNSLEYANIRAVRASTDVGYTSGTFTFTGNNTLNIAELAYTHGTGVFTQGENVYLGNNNSASAYIAISGEL